MKEKNTPIIHYAPDITLTAVDYVIPISLEDRFKKADRQIQQFLTQTNPDSLCETFYDPFAEREEQLIISQMLEQKPDHLDANRSIAEKHDAELKRLDLALEQVEEAIRDYEAEISALQKMFNRHNGMEV